MYQRKRTTGNANTDRGLDDIYLILNKPGSGITGGGTAQAEKTVITDEGGFGIYMRNGGGYKLQKGVLVRGAAANRTIIEAPENAYDIFGVVYEEVPVYSFGLIVISGLVDILFNANGASYDHYFRMSKTGDTANTDNGKAQSDSINRIDTIRLLGYPVEQRSGEGLARCLLKR